MKKFLKITFFVLAIVLAGVFIFGYSKNEKLPEGKKGKDADSLATKMLTALNKNAYDNVKVITWSFKGIHHYKWYKQEHKVDITWDDKRVLLYTKEKDRSSVYIEGKETNNTEVLNKAISLFNNDSFWLVAPYKAFDLGTERSIVKHNDKDALLVTYTSGGSTPGDSYLWILNDNFMPTSCKMWVKVIPVGGIEATWNNWKTTKAGFKLPTKHTLTVVDKEINMEDVRGYN